MCQAIFSLLGPRSARLGSKLGSRLVCFGVPASANIPQCVRIYIYIYIFFTYQVQSVPICVPSWVPGSFVSGRVGLNAIKCNVKIYVIFCQIETQFNSHIQRKK